MEGWRWLCTNRLVRWPVGRRTGDESEGPVTTGETPKSPVGRFESEGPRNRGRDRRGDSRSGFWLTDILRRLTQEVTRGQSLSRPRVY